MGTVLSLSFAVKESPEEVYIIQDRGKKRKFKFLYLAPYLGIEPSLRMINSHLPNTLSAYTVWYLEKESNLHLTIISRLLYH